MYYISNLSYVIETCYITIYCKIKFHEQSTEITSNKIVLEHFLQLLSTGAGDLSPSCSMMMDAVVLSRRSLRFKALCGTAPVTGKRVAYQQARDLCLLSLTQHSLAILYFRITTIDHEKWHEEDCVSGTVIAPATLLNLLNLQVHCWIPRIVSFLAVLLMHSAVTVNCLLIWFSKNEYNTHYKNIYQTYKDKCLITYSACTIMFFSIFINGEWTIYN